MNGADDSVGFLGCGNMGYAILAGMLQRQVLPSGRIVVFDPDPARRVAAQALGVAMIECPSELAARCGTLVLAVKPQVFNDALAGVPEAAAPNVRVISIMAGISIRSLRRRFGAGARIIRVMPNTPVLVGAGAAGIAHDENCLPSDIEAARAIFDAVGVSEIVPETMMDAVTALSGCGPAYCFYLVECMAVAAVSAGLPPETAARLAAQTLYGSGKLLLESGEAPAALREKVTSKGGATFAAMEHLRSRNFEWIVREAMRAAEDRAKELGR